MSRCKKRHLLFRKWFRGGPRSVLAIGSSLPSLLGALQSSQGGVCTARDQLGNPSFEISYSISTWHHLARCLRASYDRDDVSRCGWHGAVYTNFIQKGECSHCCADFFVPQAISTNKHVQTHKRQDGIKMLTVQFNGFAKLAKRKDWEEHDRKNYKFIFNNLNPKSYKTHCAVLWKCIWVKTASRMHTTE